jgi:cyclic beta-1,2-glucan synthetase
VHGSSGSRPAAAIGRGVSGAAVRRIGNDGVRLPLRPSRRLLAIGYNVSERRRDASFYDLLASEARLGSFVAIAQGQLEQEHWFALGRLLTTANGQPALLSWSGSMFEYLMPLLVMPTYKDTLLDQTYAAVIDRHSRVWAAARRSMGDFRIGLQLDRCQIDLPISGLWRSGTGFQAGASR